MNKPKPIQFTVRSYLALTVLISFLFGAVHLLGDRHFISVWVIASWLALGGLCLIVRASAPLVALGVGPVVVTLLWCVFAATGEGRGVPCITGDRLVLSAFAWGLLLSAVTAATALARGCWNGCRIWLVRAGGSVATSADPSLPHASRFLPLALEMAVTRVAVTAPLLFATLLRGDNGERIAPMVTSLLDLPFLPIYTHLAVPASQSSSIGLVLGSAVTGGALYFAVGWMIDYAGDRLLLD